MAVALSEVHAPDEILALQQRIYAGDAAFVPPIDAWVRRRLDPAKNAFLRDAELRLFVARRDGEVVGTISALRDPQHERVHGEKVAFFGWFECIDDAEVAAALLEHAAAQARAWGATILRGPRNLTRIEETGLCVEGHGARPPFLAGHHPAYLGAHVEAAGLHKHHDVLAYDIDLCDPDGTPRKLPERLERAAARVRIAGLEVRGPRYTRLFADIGVAHEVFVEGFRDVPENTPMPRAQFVGLGGGLVLVTHREMLQIATVNGQPAGFALCFPEINEALGAAGGRWTGLPRALWALRSIRTASFKLIGLVPKYRNTGLHALLIRQAIAGVQAAGYSRLEASLIDERNSASRRVVESAGLKVYKRYRVYERAV